MRCLGPDKLRLLASPCIAASLVSRRARCLPCLQALPALSSPSAATGSGGPQPDGEADDDGIRFVYEIPRRFTLGVLRKRRMSPPTSAKPRIDLLVEGNPLGTSTTRVAPLSEELRTDAAAALTVVLRRKTLANPDWKMPRVALLSLVLCDDPHIRELNSRHRGKDAPTDVLSFEMDDDLDYRVHLPVKLMGDLVVSLDTAERQAAERGHSLLDECRILLVHGLLHLAGYDHERGREAHLAMAAEEAAVLSELGWRGQGLIAAAEEAAEENGGGGGGAGDADKKDEGAQAAAVAAAAVAAAAAKPPPKAAPRGGRGITAGAGAGFLWQQLAGGGAGEAEGKAEGGAADPGSKARKGKAAGGGGGRDAASSARPRQTPPPQPPSTSASSSSSSPPQQRPSRGKGSGGGGGGGGGPGPSRGGRGGGGAARAFAQSPAAAGPCSGPASSGRLYGTVGGSVAVAGPDGDGGSDGGVNRSSGAASTSTSTSTTVAIGSSSVSERSDSDDGAASTSSTSGSDSGGDVAAAEYGTRRRRRTREIAIVALDLDGTLLDSRSRILPSSVAAIRAAAAAGVAVVAATGKARPAALAAAAAAGLAEPGLLVWQQGPGVFLQGLAVHGRGGRALSDAALPHSVVEAAYSYSASSGVSLCAFLGDTCATPAMTPQLRELHTTYYEPLAEVVPSASSLLYGPPVRKLLFMSDPRTVSEELLPYWTAQLEGSGAQVMQAVPNMLEIVPSGVNKWAGVVRLLDHLGLPPSALMAVGDGGNDLEMVAGAGLGVAMGNAVPAVVAAADEVVAGHDHGGVAEAFERFVL